MTAEWAAVGYLAVALTALAFVLWYAAVLATDAARAGLLTGVAPISAALGGVLLGGAVPSAPVWIGIAVLVARLALGLRPESGTRRPRTGRPVRRTARSPGSAN